MHTNIIEKFKKNYFIYIILGFYISFNFNLIDHIFSESILFSILSILLIISYLDFILYRRTRLVQIIRQWRIQLSNFLLDLIFTTFVAFVFSIVVKMIGLANKTTLEGNCSFLLQSIFLILFSTIYFGFYYWFVYWLGGTEDFNQKVVDKKLKCSITVGIHISALIIIAFLTLS